MLESARVGPTIAVSDLARAKVYYAETLGLKLREERPTGCLFDCGGGTYLDVYPSKFAGTAQHTVAGFELPDIIGAMAELRGRGVIFEEYDQPELKTENGVAQLGPYRVCWFKDPDGNTMSIVQHD
jgi:catechol 2,3-dioxygenase-like lactoylglutathione lyase family enzyme